MTGAKRHGFTLVEILIVALIFALIATALSEIFVAMGILHRKIANTAILSQDMRFATELIVREARNDEIDYNAYGGTIPAMTNILQLKRQNGTSIWISQRSNPQTGCDYTLTDSCLALSVDNGTTWSQITSGRVSVRAFNVFIRPALSPFVMVGTVYQSYSQPFVTVYLDLLYKAERPKEQASLQVQTSVSSRVYRR